MWDFIKLLENPISYKLSPRYILTKIRWNFRSCDLQNGVYPPHRPNLSIVAIREVKWCKFYPYFDKQSSLKSFPNKNTNFLAFCKIFGKMWIWYKLYKTFWVVYIQLFWTHVFSKFPSRFYMKLLMFLVSWLKKIKEYYTFLKVHDLWYKL